MKLPTFLTEMMIKVENIMLAGDLKTTKIKRSIFPSIMILPAGIHSLILIRIEKRKPDGRQRLLGKKV